MSSYSRFLVILLLAAMAVFVGCGGSVQGSNGGGGSGPFSAASLNGSYVFAFSGTNSFGFFAMAGQFQANGNGNLTSGVLDINSGGGIFTNVAFTGTYTVRGNGQGTATLVSSLQNFNIDFVVISAQRALVIRFDTNATASGSIDAQNSSALSNAALAGTFAFNLAGIDASQNTFVSGGAIDTNGSGTIVSGVQDNNDNGTPSTNLPVTGSYNVGANGRSVMALNTTLGTLNFVFYVVDSNRLKLVEIDSVPVLSGDAIRQQGPFSNASVSGPLAFTLGGESSTLPFAAGGVLSASGTGTITSGVEDLNNNGTVTQNLAVIGTYAIASDGRGTLTLSSTAGSSNFVIYPTVAGVQAIQVDVGVLSSGAAFAQSGAFSTATIQGTYGAQLSGVSGSGEVDSIAQFTANGSGTLNGALDVNNSGALSLGFILSGTYTLAGNGRGTAQLHSSFGTQNLIIYGVSGSRVLFIEADSGLLAVGAMEHQ